MHEIQPFRLPKLVWLAALVACVCCNASPLQAATFDWATVGHAGNAADQDYGYGAYGAVPYEFRISKYEVTNQQYVEYLNAVAVDDPNGVFVPEMDNPTSGGITRSGSPGSYSYAVKPGRDNYPMSNINYAHAARFANWLHNGQPTGPQGPTTTEDGAYVMTGDLVSARAAGASYFLPSRDEWYKSAYYDPRSAAQGGPAGDDNYWLYPTRSDSAPIAESPLGGINSANYSSGAGFQETEVGAYADTMSFYGAFDMAGNLWEWNEPALSGNSSLRGGSLLDGAGKLAASANPLQPEGTVKGTSPFVGFRVAAAATPVPEPSTVVMASLAVLAPLGIGARRKLPRR